VDFEHGKRVNASLESQIKDIRLAIFISSGDCIVRSCQGGDIELLSACMKESGGFRQGASSLGANFIIP